MQRRRFLQSSLLLGWQSLLPAWAQSAVGELAGIPGLQGNEFDLTIREARAQVAGKRARPIKLNDQFPAPLLRWREGDDLTLRVHNTLDEASSIHWHGILLPWQMDGVPGVSFPGIPAGQTFTYRFPLRQAGTYWYHSHSGLQEQSGHYGPIIIDPVEPEPFAYEREYVVLLSDWTFEKPERVFSRLKKMSDSYNYQQRTVFDFFRDVRDEGLDSTLAERMMWGDMRMNPTDLADVTAATYTYLVNGHSPAENWTALFQRGERIRLRFINASSMSIFNVRIPGLPMTVVQSDGLNVQPVETDEFQIGTAETFDVIVQPQAEQAYAIYAESNDRFGYAGATLAPRAGMQAAVPPLRPRPLLTMKDMGMDHGPMTAEAVHHSAMEPAGMDHTGMNHAGVDHAGTDNSGVDQAEANPAPAVTGEMDHSAMNHSTMNHSEMDHSAMNNDTATAAEAAAHAAMDHSAMPMAGMDHSAMNHGAVAADSVAPAPAVNHADHAVSGTSAHAHEMGPGVTNMAMNSTNRLHERPLGLEAEAHRVLVYGKLRSLDANPDQRVPARTLELHLTANMERYMWSFDGLKFSEVSEPIALRLNERVRLTLVNDTMMPHPIHLHGMYFDVVTEESAHKPRKHTLVIKPAERLSVDITADAPGEWAFHCHLLYHMHAGMMRTFRVSGPGTLS